MSRIELEISNRQSATDISMSLIEEAADLIFPQPEARRVGISMSLVGDDEMERLNWRHLRHEGTTDVLTFVLEESADVLEIEIIANGEEAARTAIDHGWEASEELLLYVVHAMLHAAGMTDTTDTARASMFARQREILVELGIPQERVAHAVRF